MRAFCLDDLITPAFSSRILRIDSALTNMRKYVRVFR
jgi:hypothetical protein